MSLLLNTGWRGALLLAFAFMQCANLFSQIQASQTSGCVPLIAVQFTHSFPGATGIQWDFGNGASSTNANPSHTFQTAGTFTVTFTANGGIQETLTINVLQRPQASFSIVGESGGCIPLQVQFADNSVPSAGTSLVSWSWDFGDGGVATGANANPSHTYTLVGINDVVLVVQDDNGCSGSFSINDAVVASTEPELTLSSSPANTSACNAPLTVDFSAEAASNSPQSGALTYAWELGQGVTAAVANPAAQTYNEDGDYPISIVVVDDVGCSSALNTNVFVGSPQSGIELLGGPNFCDTVYVVNQSDPATTSINWGGGNATNYNFPPDTVMFVYDNAGDYEVSLTVSSPGCSSSSSVELTIDDTEVSFASSPNFTCEQELTVLYEAFSENGDIFQWTFPGDTNVYEGQSFSYTHVSPASEDPYFAGGPDLFGAELTMTTFGGCVGTFSAFNDTIWVPFAAYAVDLSDGCAPLTVAFADSSSAPSEITGWEWNFGDGTTVWLDDMDEPYEHTYTVHGDFDPFLVIHTAEGCTDTSFVVPIAVGTESVPDLNFSTVQVCPDDEIDFQILLPGNFEPDMWSIETDNNQFSGCPNDPDATTGSLSSGAGFHDVTIYTSYNGCVSENTIQNAIEVLGPVGHLRASLSCDDPLTVVYTGNISGADSWTFDFGDGNAMNTSAVESTVHTYASPGAYEATLTSIAGTGCPDFTSSVVVNLMEVEAVLEDIDDAYCLGDEVFLHAGNSSAVHTDCNEGYLWIFDPGLDLAPFRSEFPITALNPENSGDFTVQMVAQDYNGCTDTATVVIKVYEVDADFEITGATACLPLVAQFNDVSTADTTIASWDWTFSGGGGSTEQNPEYTFHGTGNQSFGITLTVTDVLGCTGNSTQSITPDMPSATFNSTNLQVCTDEEVNFTATVPGYPLYSWDFGNGLIGDGPSATTTYEEGGLYPVTLAVQNEAGCTDTVTVNNYVNVQDFPDVGFSTNVDDIQHLCYPILIEFTDTTNANVFDYREWDLGTGFPVVANPTVGTIYENPGTYFVSLEVGTTFGCVGSVERAFVIEGPVADFAMSTDAVCLYDSVQLAMTDSSDVAYFMWDFGNGSDSAMVDPVSYTYNEIPSGGSTFIQLILWSTDSVCSATVQQPFTLNRTIADFDRNLEIMEEDTIHCFGITDVFTNQSTDATNYIWDFGNGGSSTSVSPNYKYPVGGDWSVTLYAFNTATGCSDTISKPMKIYPEMVTGAEDGLACIGDTIFLSAFGGATYEWSPAHVVSNPSVPDPFVFSDVNNNLEVLITDTNDCSQLLPVLADYISEPPRPAWSDTSITYGEPLFINYPSIPYHTFTWTSINGGACPGCGTENFYPNFDMSVGLTVTDELGCYESVFDFGIAVDSELYFYMPNAFTPNGDGVNDLLFPVVTQALSTGYRFSIWNRNGELIWETTDINGKWNGSSAGSEYFVDVEMYIYKIRVLDLRSEAHEFNGHVTLIR